MFIVKSNFSAGSKKEPFDGKVGEVLTVPTYVSESLLKELVDAGLLEMTVDEPKVEPVVEAKPAPVVVQKHEKKKR